MIKSAESRKKEALVEAKDEIYKKFNQCMTKGGVLFIGSTEQIMNYKELGFVRDKSFFFEKE